MSNMASVKSSFFIGTTAYEGLRGMQGFDLVLQVPIGSEKIKNVF